MAAPAQCVLTPEVMHQTKLDLLRWDDEGQFPTTGQQELVREGFQRLGFERVRLEFFPDHWIYAINMGRGSANCPDAKAARVAVKRMAAAMGFNVRRDQVSALVEGDRIKVSFWLQEAPPVEEWEGDEPNR